LDRQQLGFSCIKDIDSVEPLLDFTSTLNNSLTYIAQKSNKTFIFIFSKEKPHNFNMIQTTN